MYVKSRKIRFASGKYKVVLITTQDLFKREKYVTEKGEEKGKLQYSEYYWCVRRDEKFGSLALSQRAMYVEILS